MYRLATIFLVLLLTACGTSNQPEEPESQPTNGEAGEDNKEKSSEGNDSVSDELQLNVVSFTDNKAVIELQNQTQSSKELQFSSGQQYDMWITDQDGKEVFHWAEGKMFTQALKTITIEPGQKHTFEVDIPKLDPGTYKVRFKVTSKPPIETSFTHTIE
ncbi:BsuPI-related putative proteinase inhibitor [Bacillus sp. Marseille-Q3570]|uniref:BsuPI-related putative proteinase inhibitor n=1 Tax=Bacillus sp. Marseille-Q3570 TaxID=2963522 RepID=UPI0021B808BE|nr:BsuPI-related putative proteinase inhibitor [Bacillus sp. Marseille-Q3570]